MIGGLLVDTGFFFALREARDQYHASAEEKKHLLDRWEVILPWPVLNRKRFVDVCVPSGYAGLRARKRMRTWTSAYRLGFTGGRLQPGDSH